MLKIKGAKDSGWKFLSAEFTGDSGYNISICKSIEFTGIVKKYTGKNGSQKL